MRDLPGLLAAVTLVLTGPACPPSAPPDVPYQSTRVVCGNDRRASGEACDGVDLDDTTCGQLGFGAGVLACKPDCQDFDRAGCGAPSTCGDSVRNGVEICDGVDLAGTLCESLGLGPGSLGCRANCGDFDTHGCAPPPDCGDDEVNGAAELCDGQDLDSLTCQRMGFSGGELRCAADCLSFDRSRCVGGIDAAVPDAAHGDGGVPDTMPPDSQQPDTRPPDSTLADLRPADQAIPDLAVPDQAVATDTVWPQDTAVATDSAVATDAWGPPDGGVPALTIYEIQDPFASQHPIEGTWVSVNGVVVTAIDGSGSNHGFWVQDPTGGKYSGIFVYKTLEDPFVVTTLQRGDVVNLTGLYIEYYQLSELQLYSVTRINTVTPLAATTPYDLGSDPEGWEGVLLWLGSDCQVTEFYAYGEVQTTCARLDDEIAQFDVELGWSYSSISGVWHFSFDNYKLLPRDGLDFGTLTTLDAGSTDI